MKTSYSIAFFVLIFIVVGAIFLIMDKEGIAPNRTLGQILPCNLDKMSDNVLALDADTSLMRVMVSLKDLPMTDRLEGKMNELNIKIYKDKQLFNYVVADVPVESLCPLAEDSGISKIFIPDTPEQQ
ncbi:hypothetical protein C0580_03380 [Candidatus Parcubacteria bacterium]|nr:MAG: hypothetical protein C0580_03380 [Candidatus Parcubacteria bacterium]